MEKATIDLGDQDVLLHLADGIRMMIPEHKRPPLDEFFITLNNAVDEIFFKKVS